MAKTGKTKAERKFYSGMTTRLKFATDCINGDRQITPEKAKSLAHTIETSVGELKIPKHHPHKRVGK